MNERLILLHIVDSINLWYKRLGHINFSYINKISNDKYKVCVEAKFTKKICKQVQYKETKLLSLIHNDLGDLK